MRHTAINKEQLMFAHTSIMEIKAHFVFADVCSQHTKNQKS